MSDSIHREIEKHARNAIVQRALLPRRECRDHRRIAAPGRLLPPAFPANPALVRLVDVAADGRSRRGGRRHRLYATRKNAAQAVADMFHEEHDPKLIKDKELRAKYERALEYYDRLQEVSAQMKTERLRERTGESVRQMEEWVSNIYRLALRLQAFKRMASSTATAYKCPKPCATCRPAPNWKPMTASANNCKPPSHPNNSKCDNIGKPSTT